MHGDASERRRNRHLARISGASRVAQRLQIPKAKTPCGEQSMSTFDNPFDPNRRLHSTGCSCGLHVSEAEHFRAEQLQVQPAIDNEANRYEGVVASAVMRAMFP